MHRIAIPKGALLEDSIGFLRDHGITFQMSERKLLFETNDPEVQVLIVRPKDVAVYVQNGSAHLGIVGSDILGEESFKVITLKDLEYGRCDLVVAVPKDSPIKKISMIPDYCKIATKFPNLAKEYFRSCGVPIEVIELYGSIEIAPLTGLSSAIVDLVGSGRTLKENGLVPLETISKHSARLIVNRVCWQLNHQWVMKFME